MPAPVIGGIRFGNKLYEVKYDLRSRHVYVSHAGWTRVGSADSPRDAMSKAEAWLLDNLKP
ncbi:MAG: hypothetical protein V1816_03005 [Pseudomonadota bacterium]